MFDKVVTAIEPFAFTLIILAGANMAGYVSFSNSRIIGIVVVFLGFLLIVKHVANAIMSDTKKR